MNQSLFNILKKKVEDGEIDIETAAFFYVTADLTPMSPTFEEIIQKIAEKNLEKV